MPSIRITCPGCAATYEVPEQHARAGRSVRCAGCGNEWPAFDTPAPEADPQDSSRSIAASLKQHAVPVLAEAGSAEGEPDPPDVASPEEPPAHAADDAGPDADWDDAELPDFDAARLAEAADGKPAARAARARPRPTPEAWWRAAWAASLLLLAGLGVGGMHWREPIMAGWPPAGRLYAALGTAHMPRAATADRVAPAAANAISSSPSRISPPGVRE